MSDLAAALDIVGARWALLLLERPLEGPQRDGDLHGVQERPDGRADRLDSRMGR